jgi:hypothetical protein
VIVENGDFKTLGQISNVRFSHEKKKRIYKNMCMGGDGAVG